MAKSGEFIKKSAVGSSIVAICSTGNIVKNMLFKIKSDIKL